MAHKIIQTGCLFLALLCFGIVRAEDATAGLYVCTGSDGIRNIVNKPTGKQCVAYQKGILRQKNTPPVPKKTPVPISHKTSEILTVGAKKPDATGKPAQKKTPAEILRDSTTVNPQEKTSPVLFPPAAGFSGNSGGEIYRLLGFVPPPRPAVITPAKAVPAENAEPAKPLPAKIKNKNETATAQIWVCAQADGTPVIVESDKPLQECQPLGRKAQASDKATAPPPSLPHRGKPLVSNNDDTTGSGEIALTDSPPQDIYKCFDKQGKPNFVGANQRSQFLHCRFFSRSFAGVHTDFIRKTTGEKKNLLSLAAAGVQQKKQYDDGPGLHCIGAGSITFHGQSRHFNCATRSFDYTPGTSGGNIRLGNQQASVAAHNLDYMNTRGSCGGTITSENGRVFHLEPTKDCPQAIIIQARRMLSNIEKQLNIPTSGAFRQRQRTLAAQINQIAGEVGIDPYLVHAIISAESAYKYRAVSHAGARGLMQLMPATARRFGVNNTFHTGENIRGGATYLKWLLDYFNGNIELAIAGYNAGEGNVKKYGNKIPPFIETRAYVPKVLQYYRRYRNHPSEIGL